MRYTQPTESQTRKFAAWVAERPDVIRALIAERGFDPWTLYRLKTTGQRVYIISFSEPEAPGSKVMLRVVVSGKFNLVAFERGVFGIDPDDLEECDLPDPTEQVGTLDIPPHLAKSLRDQYQDRIPQHVLIDLIARYPVQKGTL